MLRHHMALLWSAESNWFVAINMWPRCGQNLSNNTQLSHYAIRLIKAFSLRGERGCDGSHSRANSEG